ncbi:MAG: hypothetical protein HRU41_01000 [Saprospiraceae bacterium]|nr:hypothetical protein [Saprospiraceae bacterium]
MQNSQLIELLATFRRKEWIEATKFVKSPFHNSRSDVLPLLIYLKKMLPRGLTEKLDKELVFTALYPGESYDEKKIRYLMSFLYQLMQDYLAYVQWKEDNLQVQNDLLHGLRLRGLQRSFSTTSNRLEKDLREHPLRNPAYHLQQSRFHEEMYRYSTLRTRQKSTGFQAWTQHSHLYFMLQQLRQACVAISHQTVLKDTYRLPFLSAVLREIEAGDYEEHRELMLFYYLYQSLEGGSQNDPFPQLQALIVETGPLFPKTELKSIYLFALNHCIQQLNQGRRNYLQYAFQLYQQGLEADIFLENGYLSRFTYNNIALAGMGLKAFDWTEQFLRNYQNHIEEQYRLSTYNFNLATLYYRKGEFLQAMTLLRATEFKDVLHGLEGRKMLLVIYYEREEISALQSLLDSFKSLLYRQKRIGYHKENYLNLIRFTQQLLNYTSTDQAGLGKLSKAIKQADKVAEREWLLEKVASFQ